MKRPIVESCWSFGWFGGKWMTAYEELLSMGQERIFDLFKNVKLHKSQFHYSDFNTDCYEAMYLNNSQDHIKTVKELKEEIEELKPVCRDCGSYFMNVRNNSIKKYDVMLGRMLEDVIIDFLREKYKLNVMHGDNTNKKYPARLVVKGCAG